MKKLKNVLFILVLFCIVSVLIIAEENEYKRNEVSFYYLATTDEAFTNWIAHFRYGYHYNSPWISYGTRTALFVPLVTGYSPGGSYSRYFTKNLGVQVGFEWIRFNLHYPPHPNYLSGKIIPESTGSVAIQQKDSSSIFPLSINGIGRLNWRNFGTYISGGYTMHILNINTQKAYTDIHYQINEPDNWVEYWVPLKVDVSGVAHGFNLGGGFEIRFKQRYGIFVEYRHYFEFEREVNWEWIEGMYDIQATDICQGLEELLPYLDVEDSLSFSFFYTRFSIGIKYIF